MLSSTSNLASIKAVSNGSNDVAIRFIPLSSGSGSEAMRIDSSGNVGIGKSSNLFYRLTFAESSGDTGRIGWVSTSGNRKSSIDCANTAAIRFNIGTTDSEVARVTDSGLTFNGDTAAANALDDYEEGDWTPTSGTDFGTFSNVDGSYVKIGNLVTVNFIFNAASTNDAENSFGSNSGVWYISGLPFSLKTQAGGAYQSITGNYFGLNGTDYFLESSHRWQANNTDGNQTLTVYGPQRTTNWSSGYMEVSGSGVVMVL